MSLNLYELNKKQLVIFRTVFIISSVLVSYLFFNDLYFVFFQLILYKPMKNMIEKELLIKKKREFLIQFKDLLYTLSSFIGAGRGMREALKESKIQLSYIYCEDDYIILALNDLIGELSSENSVDSNVIRNFAQETGLEDVVQFANMFTTCKKTGANLIVAMNKGAEVIGEKISAEDEIKAYLSQKRTEGRLMVTMPFIMVCFLKFSGQGYFDIIYQTLAGKLIMLGCLFAIVIVYISIERIVCIEM